MVSKHKHKENLETLGSIVERLEALWKCLNAFRALRERVGSFSWLDKLGSMKPYGMVCYAMLCYAMYVSISISRKIVWERWGAS